MKPKDYYYFYCYRCGWGICAFQDSDMYQQYEKSHQKPNCPHCKRPVRGFLLSTLEKPLLLNLEFREPVPRRPISKRQRAEIQNKYGEKCALCGSSEDLQIDHIIPVIDHGTNDAANLQVLCKLCNSSKGANDSISARHKRYTEMISQIKQSCSHLSSKERLSMAEIARVSGVGYYYVLMYQDRIRKALGFSKKSTNPPENATVET